MDSLKIYTYGCKVNSYDTGLMESRLKDIDLKDLHILNTCAVTAEATKEALRQARKIKRAQPHAKVVITGCSAQVDTESFLNLKDVDLVVANSHKGELAEILREHYQTSPSLETPQVYKSNIFKKSDLGAGGGLDSSHTRSFLKVQDGCNSFCTFCVIPFARGKSRSLTIDEIVDRVHEIYDQGVREVVITGIHIGDYEDDFFGSQHKRGLEDLMEQLLIRTKMPRFRISSLEPLEISDRLLDLYQEPAMCPHFHLSLQSVHDGVLKGMKRKNTSQQAEECLKRIYQKIPQVFVGMDLIVGFPGEGEREFKEVHQKLTNWPWTQLHVFPYSERPGTFALKLPDKNNRSIALKRSKILRQLSEQRFQSELVKQVGQMKKVILLKNSKSSRVQGLSRDYWKVALPLRSQLHLSEELTVKITGVHQNQLVGEWGEECLTDDKSHVSTL